MKLVATLLLALPAFASAFIVAPAQQTSTQLFANDRRNFLATGIATGVAAAFTSPPPALAADGVDYKAVASDIADLIKKNPDQGPTMVRLAWHSSATVRN